MKKLSGFTLAEVLITLGIIGVVAAITMPTLIQNHKKKVVETRLLKMYSSINQAINRSVSDNGEVETWEFPANNYDEVENFNKKYILPYLNVIKYKTIKLGDYRTAYYFADGSVIIFSSNLTTNIFFPNAKDMERYMPYIEDEEEYSYVSDTNQVSGTKWFTFTALKHTRSKGIQPYGYTVTDEDELLRNSNYSCKADDRTGKPERAYCARVIQLNGWKIPKDYPLRF